MRRIVVALLLACVALAGCVAQPSSPYPGEENVHRLDPHPGIDQDLCSDTDKPGYQRVCIELSTYCDGHGTPFAFTAHIQAVGRDRSIRRWRDPVTGEETEVNVTIRDSTELHPDPTQDTALRVIAVDYLMQIPPSLLLVEIETGATATRGCDAFVAHSAPGGQGLLGSFDDRDYFLAEQDFVPLVLFTTLEIPYLRREV